MVNSALCGSATPVITGISIVYGTYVAMDNTYINNTLNFSNPGPFKVVADLYFNAIFVVTHLSNINTGSIVNVWPSVGLTIGNTYTAKLYTQKPNGVGGMAPQITDFVFTPV